ncbi:hypothetical protein Sa4125_25520 [Aureimonas sp. SA4125]|uniref:DUF4326 domain-containing protein n=1 Tax=Aureimonas sp. SA4125 TaxID=2826993 RepID=UPI001CC490CF|nr:DUF4326 domain-containing protein [Aureimonas sp. SA4125]BDA85010.1 hypothetical protein Sa4125_25520 [Aureimonas sp. SA4125]
MTRPVRIRLSRARGFDLQAHSRESNGLSAISVARPGPFGNPFVIGRDGDREHCVSLHRAAMDGLLTITTSVPAAEVRAVRSVFIGRWRDLAGHNLACWCRLDGKPCHADTLLEAVAIMEKNHG